MSVPAAAVGAATAIFAAACALFVRQAGLGTFADDSVGYLVMAQVFSPWREASAAVAAAFPAEAYHPPLFPLLLALAGAAHDFARAHVLNALLVAACTPFVYALGARWLDSRGGALAAALAFVLLPGVWVEARGILSEPLFSLVLLATLWALEASLPARTRGAILGALFCALCLTRSAGVVLAIAYAAWAATRPASARERLGEALPALAGVAAYAAWVLLRPLEVVDINAATAADRLRAILHGGAPLEALGGGIARQALAMQEAWSGLLLLFWVEGQPARPLLAALLGALALAGLVLRWRRGRADAWMSTAYLALYLLWPFYDQMTRFLFPLLPVLVLYAFLAIAAGAGRFGRAGAGAALGALLVASLAAPGLAFLAQRHRAEGPERDIVDWYRTPDLAAARSRARTHLGLAEDMEAIRALSAPGEQVMWVAPAYIALLADRRGVAAPSPRTPPADYRAAVERAAPQLVLLTRYHPRDTIREDAWRAAGAALAGQGEVVRERKDAGGATASLLIRLRR